MKQWRGKANWTCYTVIKGHVVSYMKPLTRNVKLAVTRRSRLVLRQPIISISARQSISRLASNTVHRVRLWNLASTRSMYLSPHHSISLKCIYLFHFLLCSSLSRLATGWTVRGSNFGGGEIFRICPDRPWDPPSLWYKGYWVSCPRVQRPGSGFDHPPPSSPEIKNIIELYLCSCFGPSWAAIGWTTA